MASSAGYLQYILDQLSGVEGVSSRPMMGEYLLYVRGRLFGGVYDDRLLVKPVKAAVSCLEWAGRAVTFQRPYQGAKELLLIEDTDDSGFLSELIEAMYGELPAPKRKRQKSESGQAKPETE